MKAWLVGVKYGECAEVVFAETRGQAKSLATHTDIVDFADFVDIEAHRLPKADKYYKEGKWHLDWIDPQDRIVLVNECGFRCEYVEPYMCKDCSAKEYCEDYQEYLAEEEGVQE